MDNNNEEVVLTASMRGSQAVMRLERVRHGVVNMNDVHRVTAGPYKGILIKKTPDDTDNINQPEAHVKFLTFLENVESEPVTDLWEVKFWSKGSADSSTKKMAFNDFFQELVSAKNLPKNYVGFVTRALVLLQKSGLVRQVQLEVQEQAEPGTQEDEFPRISNSFVTMLTPADNSCYQTVPNVQVHNKTSVTFKVKTAGEARLWLCAAQSGAEGRRVEVVLGADNNSVSFIRDGAAGAVPAKAITVNLLNADTRTPFWISWQNDVVRVGRGKKLGGQQFLQWTVPHNRQFKVNSLAVSTSKVGEGQWEFAVTEELDVHKAVRRSKMRLSLLWDAKKHKMLQLLEDAYPDPLPEAVLYQKCLVKQSDKVNALLLLKDLQKREVIKEVDNGAWVRMQTKEELNNHDVELVKEMPLLSPDEQPTLAIVTAAFQEKVAVDAMMENKRTYLICTVTGDSEVYTLGFIGKTRVVSTKLSKRKEGVEAEIVAEDTATRLMDNFSQVEHVLLVGVGGAVPHYSDISQHVRLGDVVVSTPVDSSGAQYLYCQKVERVPGTSGYDYNNRTFGSENPTLVKLVQTMQRQVDLQPSRERPWDSVLEEAAAALDALGGTSESSAFSRPPSQTDKLLVTNPNGSLVQCDHPRPRTEYGFKEGRVTVHYGLVGAGKFVARAESIRKEFSQSNGVKAFDADYFPVMEGLEAAGNDSFLVIRGCCDYNDGAKQRWKPFAALAAAAVMKAIVLKI